MTGASSTQEKRPRSPLEGTGSKRGRTQQWSCRACTFLNYGEGESCGVCGSARGKDVSLVPSISAAPDAQQSTMHEAAWLCQHCTYLNDRPGKVCQICSKSRHPQGPIVLNEDFYDCSESPTAEGVIDLDDYGGESHMSSPQQLGDNEYVLDCGCRHDRGVLQAYVMPSKQLPVNLRQLLGCSACPAPACRKPLSGSDMRNLLAPDVIKQLEQAICLAALRETAQQARRSRTHLQDFIALQVTCPACPDHPEMPLTGSIPSWKAAELSTALQTRGITQVPKVQAAAAALLQKVCSSAGHVCPTCPAGVKEQSCEIISTAAEGKQADMALQSSLPAGQVDTNVVDLCLNLAQHIYRLYRQLTLQPTSGPVARKQLHRQPPKPSGDRPSGIGYGGSSPGRGQAHTAVAKATSEALKRQKDADAAMTQLLADIRSCLSMSGRGLALPHVLCALCLQSTLAASLRQLLLNDSLLDIGSRRALYLELVQLLKYLGSRSELLPALLRPADADEAAASIGGGTSPAASDSQRSPAPCCMDALRVLNAQCRVFQRSAEALAQSGDVEDLDALAVALEIATAYEQLQESCATFKSATRPSEEQKHSGSGKGEGSSPRDRQQHGAEEQKALEARYVEIMMPLRYKDFPLMERHDFYFRKAVSNGKSGGNAWLCRVMQELGSLATSLPVAWSSSIFLAVDSDNVKAMRALILGPDDTPYAMGAFVFDILLPPEYPNRPPSVQFLTTGGGKWRASPNLYNTGKVCLSLLGTWQGPGWSAGSSILQVLLSIQGMIFVDDTYFNEPGFERSRGTSAGRVASQRYNKAVAEGTLQHAVLQALQRPTPAFADVIREHFKLKRKAVIDACSKLLGKNASLTRSISAELDKLQ